MTVDRVKFLTKINKLNLYSEHLNMRGASFSACYNMHNKEFIQMMKQHGRQIKNVIIKYSGDTLGALLTKKHNIKCELMNIPKRLYTYNDKKLNKYYIQLYDRIRDYEIKLNKPLNLTKNINITELYKKSNLIYIQYDAKIVQRDYGAKKIEAIKYPSYSKITTQPDENYKKYYSLLMGREYEPNKFLILLDLDAKETQESETEPATQNGLKFIQLFNLDSYRTPAQNTPSGGRHYLFYVDEIQAQGVKTLTTIKYNNIIYNTDIKFKNQLLNCQPSKINNYGEYKWINPERLAGGIAQLPADLYNVLISNIKPKSSTTRPAASFKNLYSTDQTEADAVKENIMNYDESDIKTLLSCLSTARADAYGPWFSLGQCIKKLCNVFNLWDEISSVNKLKYNQNECLAKWEKMNVKAYNIGSLISWAKQDNIEKLYETLPSLKYHLKFIYGSDVVYDSININTPYLMPRETDTPNEGQLKFKMITNDFFNNTSLKNLIIKSKYNSGKTCFLESVVNRPENERILIITYRQSLAMSYKSQFKKSGFVSYMDKEPDIYNNNKIIIQLDSLLKLFQCDTFLNDSTLKNYDLIILDEIQSLLTHLDGGTMQKKEIQIFEMLNALLTTSKKVISLDGDLNEKSLKFLTHYGDYKFINNTATDQNKEAKLIRNPPEFYEDLYINLQSISDKIATGIAPEGAGRVAVAFQSVSALEDLKNKLIIQYPNINIFSITGLNSHDEKKEVFEGIDDKLKNINCFLCSPVCEAGIDITILFNKLYGVLCSGSSTQAQLCQMLARCRNVSNNTIFLLNDPAFKVSKNTNSYKLWTFNEANHIINDNIDSHKELVLNGELLSFHYKSTAIQRQNISIYNKVEQLNTHKSLYICYLQILLENKGVKFIIGDEPPQRVSRPKTINHKLNLIINSDDITTQDYKKLIDKQQKQETTTIEAFEIEKYKYKKLLNLESPELNEKILKPFLYNDIISNFKNLIDIKNLKLENNKKTKNELKKIEFIKILIEGLGFNNIQEQKITNEDFMNNYKRNIYESKFIQDNTKNINFYFGLNKNYKFNIDTTARQLLGMLNIILSSYSISINASRTTTRDGLKFSKDKYISLNIKNDIIRIIKHQHEAGEICEDSNNYLKLDVYKMENETNEATASGLDYNII